MCVYLLLLLVGCVRGESGVAEGVISPAVPSAFTGRVLSLTCTLKNDIGVARDIRFRFTGVELNYTVEIRNRSATLQSKLPQTLKTTMDTTRVACLMGDTVLAETEIVVEEPLFPPRPSCVVYNWKNMTCTWPVSSNRLSTDLAFSRQRCNSRPTWYKSPNCVQRKANASCTWVESTNKDHFLFMDHCLCYVVRNSHGAMAIGPRHQIIVDDLVKPVQVKVVSANATADTIALSWEESQVRYKTVGRRILYKIAYTSGINHRVTTMDNSIMLYNLQPSTRYNITIDSVPWVRGVERGFRSDSTTFELMMANA